jgi:hypothetical protein
MLAGGDGAMAPDDVVDRAHAATDKSPTVSDSFKNDMIGSRDWPR